MTRLENIKQAGFFALPVELPPIIASYVAPATSVAPATEGGRIIDPCAGEGVALIQFSKLLNLNPYGVELNSDRAKLTEKAVSRHLIQQELTRMGHSSKLTAKHKKQVIQGSYSSLRTSPSSYTVNYNNPPYMFAENKEDGRTEYQFLRDTRTYLQTGGLLIWVVQQHMLMHKKTPSYLNSWYDNLTIRRFPDELYSDFKQIVVFGIKKKFATLPDREAINKIKDLGRIGNHLEPLTLQTKPSYTLPKPPEINTFKFRSWYVKPEDAIAEAKQVGVANTREFQSLFAEQIQGQFNPLTPMKIGHLVGIIASGHLNNQVLEQDGERILLKGHSFKEQVKSEKKEATETGHILRTMYTDRVMTNITYLTPTGESITLKGDELHHFMGKWIEQLTKTVSDTYQPRYEFDLNGFGKTLRRLNLKRTLPFYGKPGLLPAQMHGAAAMATQLKDNKSAILVGDMGTGKTVMSVAVAATLHNHVRKTTHTIVLCPPHLVKKWIREIKVTWPKAKAMEIKKISDVDRFFATEGPIFGVMKETVARSGSGWAHSYNRMGSASTNPRGPREEVTWHKRSVMSKDVDNRNLLQFDEADEIDPTYYRTQRFIHRVSKARCPHCGQEIIIRGDEDVPATPHSFKRKKMTCEGCNSPMYQDDRRRTKGAIMHGFKKYAHREKRIRSGHNILPSNGNNGYAKYPLATYIHRHYKHKLHLLIADEVHQYKAADSDRGYAFHRLITASQRVLALTGTIYGGKASSLFDLLYRISPEVQRAFTDKSKDGRRRMMRTKWVELYGILQEVTSASYDKHGKQSGNSKERITIKELPGASPSMLPWILNLSIFINLGNMGVALPPYEEIPIGVTMTAEMQLRYDRFRDHLTAELRERLLKNDKSLLGSYLQSLLTWPDSPWRNKQVAEPYDPDTIVARIAGIDMPLGTAPKEAAIIQQIKEEKENGRKTLLLCQQTSTLDITPQWEQMLTKAGMKVAVLRNTPPDKREAWIKKQVDNNVDVLITHPKKIETGLDLLDFPTEIWMGIEYSVYTVLQASRRAWRLGQDKPVKVYFYVYEKTLQSQAIRLIAAKVGAALRVNGDTIPDDSLAELDELAQTDMVNALTELLMKEDDYDEEMKELNAAYEAAKKGMLNYSAKYTFIDTNSRAEIRKKWAKWAKELHPDTHHQDDPESRLDDLQSAFQNAAATHNDEESFIGEYSMDVEDVAIEETEPEAEPQETFVTKEVKPQPNTGNQYDTVEKKRKEKLYRRAKFITSIPTEDVLTAVLALATAMVNVLEYEENPSVARNELVKLQFRDQKTFTTAILIRLTKEGYSEDSVSYLLDKYRATALEITDWILAKEEALFENNDGDLFQDRADEMRVLATAVWHEAHANVQPEPMPQPIAKPVLTRLEFGITSPNQHKGQRSRKKKVAHKAQLSLFG